MKTSRFIIRVRNFCAIIALSLLCALAPHAFATTNAVATRVAVLDFGESAAARRIADEFANALASGAKDVSVMSREQARAAAKGLGYKGSLNLTLADARDLGAAVGCDFFFAGEANTVLRRASAGGGDYFESYASLYIVSAQTGRLVFWERLSAEASAGDAAQRSLFNQLRARADFYATTIARARDAERGERHAVAERDTPVIEDAPEAETAAAKDFRVPLPYRRLHPPYTDAAARAGVEATVDALVELDDKGEVRSVEIVRWAGYGLDESVAATIRQMHFRPALSEGSPVATRVLLRYNFRKPQER
jgi:TonB family protein